MCRMHLWTIRRCFMSGIYRFVRPSYWSRMGLLELIQFTDPVIFSLIACSSVCRVSSRDSYTDDAETLQGAWQSSLFATTTMVVRSNYHSTGQRRRPKHRVIRLWRLVAGPIAPRSDNGGKFNSSVCPSTAQRSTQNRFDRAWKILPYAARHSDTHRPAPECLAAPTLLVFSRIHSGARVSPRTGTKR